MARYDYYVRRLGAGDVAIQWRPKLQVWDAYRYKTRWSPARWINADRLRTPSLLDAVAFVKGRGLAGLGSYDVRRGVPRKFTVAMLFE